MATSNVAVNGFVYRSMQAFGRGRSIDRPRFLNVLEDIESTDHEGYRKMAQLLEANLARLENSEFEGSNAEFIQWLRDQLKDCKVREQAALARLSKD